MPALPKNPPSVTAGTERTPFLQGCRTLFKSFNFWLLMIQFCMVMGLETSVVALLTPMMLPYGYTNNQAGIAGFVRLFSGFIAGTVTGPLIDKTGQHLLIVRLFVPLLCLTYGMVYVQCK
jgi:nitrate/nitrite transporter NarK